MSFKRLLGDPCEHLQIGTTDAQWDEIAQWCLTFCDPMEYRVHGILQARILEWITTPFSRASSQPRDQTQVSFIAEILYQLSHNRSLQMHSIWGIKTSKQVTIMWEVLLGAEQGRVSWRDPGSYLKERMFELGLGKWLIWGENPS